MHEIGLCEGVLGVALDASAGQPVKRVRLRVGRLQGVVPQVFDQAWEMVSEGTAAAATGSLRPISPSSPPRLAGWQPTT
jgi:Zn finger protein HypA/HybF involved in hydrogenase expression